MLPLFGKKRILLTSDGCFLNVLHTEFFDEYGYKKYGDILHFSSHKIQGKNLILNYKIGDLSSN